MFVYNGQQRIKEKSLWWDERKAKEEGDDNNYKHVRSLDKENKEMITRYEESNDSMDNLIFFSIINPFYKFFWN